MTTAPKNDLLKKSRAEKLELLQLLEQREALKRSRKQTFVPHEEQLAVIRSTAAERFVFCGNGWGKTAFAVDRALAWAYGFDPVLKVYTRVPTTVIVVLDIPAKVSDVWLKEMRKWANIPEEWCHKDGKPYICRVSFPNGSEIRFMFHLQEELSFESIQAEYVIFDEPPPRHIYIGLMRGTREKGTDPKMLLVGTPLAAPWLRIEIYEPWLMGNEPDVACFRGTTEANRANLREGYIEKFSKRLSEKEKRIRLEGEFFDLDGLALASLFKRKRHVVAGDLAFAISAEFMDRRHPCVIAVDPHPSKKTHAVLLGVDTYGYLFVLREIAEKKVAKDFAKDLLRWIKDFNVRDVVVDSLGATDGTGGEGFKSFISVLDENGVRARSTTYDEKSDEAFIDRIQTSLALPDDPVMPPKLRVLDCCPGTIKDIENVAWLKYRGLDMTKPKLDISNKDYLSCVKYALSTNPTGLHNRAKIIRTRRPAVAFNRR